MALLSQQFWTSCDLSHFIFLITERVRVSTASQIDPSVPIPIPPCCIPAPPFPCLSQALFFLKPHDGCESDPFDRICYTEQLEHNRGEVRAGWSRIKGTTSHVIQTASKVRFFESHAQRSSALHRSVQIQMANVFFLTNNNTENSSQCV